MQRVFLSYRRADQHAAGLLRAEIERRVGRPCVFMDTRNVGLRQEFPDQIERAVGAADIVLVLVGQGWLQEQERLADPDDWVRREPEIALGGSGSIVPVLLDDATLPATESLPAEVQRFTASQAYRVDSAHLDRDVADLTRSLGLRRSRRGLAAATAAAVVAVAGIVVVATRDDGQKLTFLNTELIFDASASMGDFIPAPGSPNGRPKAAVAEEHVRRYVETRSADTLALRVAADCGDPGELVVPFRTDAGGSITQSLASTSFTGSGFPLAASVVAATGDFNDPERFPREGVSKQIIVFTTGVGDCGGDPGDILADRWSELGEVRLSLELIGLGVEPGSEEDDALQRTAAAVDGRAFPVTSAEELDTLLSALLEVEPVRRAAEEVTAVGNSIRAPLNDVRAAHNSCDHEAALLATADADAAVDEAELALRSLESRSDDELFAMVHSAAADWARNLADVIPASEELTDLVEDVDAGSDACGELRRSEPWADAVGVWNEAVGAANTALGELGAQRDALFDEMAALLVT